jgi:hypothetical protein
MVCISYLDSYVSYCKDLMLNMLHPLGDNLFSLPLGIHCLCALFLGRFELAVGILSLSES